MSRYIKDAIFRSTYEDKIAEYLDQQGIEYAHETEAFPYVVAHKYIPDFVFYSTRILVEAKGWFTPKDRKKILDARSGIEAEGWELRFLFQKPNNKLSVKSSTTYGDWCNRHGFVWAEGIEIPRGWCIHD